MPDTALIIGLPVTCRRLERQLDLLDDRPVTIGWVLAGGVGDTGDGDPILGSIDELEAIIACRRPSLALISLPAVMSELVASVRTRLRRLGVPLRLSSRRSYASGIMGWCGIVQDVAPTHVISSFLDRREL